MKIHMVILSIFTLVSCREKEKVNINCYKSFLYNEDDLFTYYFVLNISNKTKDEIQLKTKSINYQIKDKYKNISFRFGQKYLTSIAIDPQDERNIWKINPKGTMKLMYFLESDISINEKYIYLIENNAVTDSIKVTSYIQLKKPMGFERSVYEVDGTINDKRPQISE